MGNGASAMSGIKNGVANCISDTEPWAVFTHSLNLAVGDTVKNNKIMKSSLEMCMKFQN